MARTSAQTDAAARHLAPHSASKPLQERAGDAPFSAEQRAAKRIRLLLRVAKLRTSLGEFLCVLRDVSDKGLKIRVFHKVPKDEICELELGGGEVYRLSRIWQRSDHAGFKFADGPIAVEQLIAEAGPFPKRHIRLRLHHPVPLMLVLDGVSLPAQLFDISQHGAAIALDQRLAIGCQVRIDALHLPALHARVRWRRDGLHGLVFQQGFRLDALAELAARIQLPSQARRGLAKIGELSPVLTSD